jgi:hypothetical protein
MSDSLGKVLQTFGGKSLGLVIGIGGGIAALAVVAAILGLVMREYLGGALFAAAVILVVAIMYVATNLVGVFNKLELCQGGIGISGLKGSTEIPWNQIDRIEYGTYLLNGKQRWAFTIYDVTEKQTDLAPEFWDSDGNATRLIAAAK